MIKDQKIEEFLTDLGSAKPTPGGGATAAITAATAAALVEMVANLTKEEGIKSLVEKARELKDRLLQLADEDVAAFDRVMVAYRSKDKSQIKSALVGATAVPEETKKYALKVEEMARIVEKEGNKNAVSDARTAIYLAQAAQKSAQENIDINIKSLAEMG
ncbi:MAG TPA: cyclodeaminase/cyclohydrolase family protein [Patescibacteria group bacterium]|nr:cyclodeaminase/cyclohydrolase family protein [Patescibacteria group bacterium]